MEKIFAIVTMHIEPGAKERFAACAQATSAAARTDLTGTSAYEWFLSEDGLEATVIEIYDGAEGLAHHGRMVGPTIAPLRELAKFHIEFAGDVPAAVIERSRQRADTPTSLFGARFQGRLTTPAPGRVGPIAGTMIFAVARFAIAPGHEAEFQAQARDIFAQVEAHEPGTIGYEWFLNAAGTECLVLDIYTDAAAMAAHTKHVGAAMQRLLQQTTTSQVRLFGAVPEALRSRFKPAMGISYVAPQIEGVL